MKDEEMAEQFANNGYALGCTKTPFESAKEGFLAGLKAGRPQWHKVADGDLPKGENKICLLYLGNMFNPITGWYKNGCWCFEDDRNEFIWQDKVIAWKEIVLPELPKESE